MFDLTHSDSVHAASEIRGPTSSHQPCDTLGNSHDQRHAGRTNGGGEQGKQGVVGRGVGDDAHCG